MNDIATPQESALTATANMNLWPASPFRPPDWRWARATELVLGLDRKRQWDDAWVIRSRQFLKAQRRVGHDVAGHRVAREDLPVLGALSLKQGETRRRWEVEARLLAGQNDDEIATRIGVQPSDVTAYEALYFAVRDSLKASDWITFVAIGTRLDETSSDDLETVWKSFGFHFGPLALDTLIAMSDGSSAVVPDPALASQLKLAVTLATTPVTPENVKGWLRVQALARRIDHDQAEQSVSMVMKPIAIGPIEFPIGPGIGQGQPIDRAPEAPGLARPDDVSLLLMPVLDPDFATNYPLRATG